MADHDDDPPVITPENAHLYDADAIGRVDFGDTQRQIARLKKTKEGRERLKQFFSHRLKVRGD
jgi:hypothetical protein